MITERSRCCGQPVTYPMHGPLVGRCLRCQRQLAAGDVIVREVVHDQTGPESVVPRTFDLEGT